MKCILPLTNSYFPCLRSNGCGEITLQLKTAKSLFTRTSFSTPMLELSTYVSVECVVLYLAHYRSQWKLETIFMIGMFEVSACLHTNIESTFDSNI